MPVINLSDKVRYKNILVVGTARDCAKSIEKSILVVKDALIDFNFVSFYIVESDSGDDTVKKLTLLGERLDNFRYVSLGTLSQRIPSRTERIAFCRNQYLKYIKDSKQAYDFILVTDLDGVSEKLSRQAILSCWIRDDWEACFSNQDAPYYDIWALRHPQWAPTNCWEEYTRLVNQGMRPYLAKRKAIYSKMVRIDQSSNWIEVDSAFGGLGIYKASAIGGCWYSNTDEFGYEAPDHVSFHNAVKLKGAHLFINPAMINGSWNEHNRELRKINQILSFEKYIFSLVIGRVKKFQAFCKLFTTSA